MQPGWPTASWLSAPPTALPCTAEGLTPDDHVPKPWWQLASSWFWTIRDSDLSTGGKEKPENFSLSALVSTFFRNLVPSGADLCVFQFLYLILALELCYLCLTLYSFSAGVVAVSHFSRFAVPLGFSLNCKYLDCSLEE